MLIKMNLTVRKQLAGGKLGDPVKVRVENYDADKPTWLDKSDDEHALTIRSGSETWEYISYIELYQILFDRRFETRKGYGFSGVYEIVEYEWVGVKTDD